MSGAIRRTGLRRALAQRGLAAGDAAIERDGTTIDSDVPFTVQPAATSADGMRLQATIPGLAGGRAAHIGYMPHGTDVIDGDVITSGGRTFTVEGVGLLDTCVGLALSEYGRP